jgi:transcriptional regulator GlxA family with amidase domain
MGRIETWTSEQPAAPPFGAIAIPLDALERIGPPRNSTPRPGADAIARLKVAKVSTALDLFDRLDRARHFLHANVDRTVSLRELGAVANLSTFHLARFFKLAFGAAPIAYHRRLRLERAAALLGSGSLSVATVADLVGYSDAVAFSHAFRKHFGVTPRRLIAPA